MAEYIERTEELVLAMNAGARAIENTRRYHGAIYSKDVFSESTQKIPYLLAAKVLRGVEEAPAADVAPVVHGCFEPSFDENGNWRQGFAKCSNCGKEYYAQVINHFDYCPNCGAKMDGESTEGDVGHGMGSKE